MAEMRKKITFTITESVLERLDSESDKLGVNRSALISIAINSYFQNLDVLKALPEMQKMVNDMKYLKDNE